MCNLLFVKYLVNLVKYYEHTLEGLSLQRQSGGISAQRRCVVFDGFQAAWRRLKRSVNISSSNETLQTSTESPTRQETMKTIVVEESVC